MFQYDADNSKVDDGIWKEYRGSKFLIAHLSNMKFQRALAKHQQPYRKKLENGTMDPKTQRQVLGLAMAEGLLLDWKDVVAKDNSPTPYSKEAALTALIKSADLRDFVTEVAGNMSLFIDEEDGEVGED
jgi:hypothetical protein